MGSFIEMSGIIATLQNQTIFFMSNSEQAVYVPDHGLEFPGFSAVFIQTFSIRGEKKFRIPDKYKQSQGWRGYAFR